MASVETYIISLLRAGSFALGAYLVVTYVIPLVQGFLTDVVKYRNTVNNFVKLLVFVVRKLPLFETNSTLPLINNWLMSLILLGRLSNVIKESVCTVARNALRSVNTTMSPGPGGGGGSSGGATT